MIAIQAGRQHSDIQVQFIANQAHYDMPVLDRHRERLLRLIELVAAQPTVAIGRLAILSDVERRQVLHDWNATDAPYPQDRIFARVFEDQAARAPEAIAVSYEGATLSYAELNARAKIPDGVETLDLDALAKVGSADNPPCAGRPQDTAYVIYTSGSTGRPKGVAVPHGALLNFLCSMQETPGLTAEDVLAAVTTMSFDIAALELYLPLMVGARI